MIVFFSSLVLSLVLTRVMISVAPKIGLLDQPGERRIHSAPIPRAGGIAVWLTFITVAGIFTAYYHQTGSMNWTWFLGFALTSGFLVAIGVIDDGWGLSAWLKLLCHVMAAVVMFYARGVESGEVFGIEVPWGFDLVIWVIWTVFLINAFNLIDGMDGLCAGLASIALGSLAVLSAVYHRGDDAILLLVMLGALLGFLRYNFHPAKIFLGDAGSMLVGFFIATAASSSLGERLTLASLLLPIVVAGVPLLDVILAVWRRSFRSWLGRLGKGEGSKVFGADQYHLHHRLLSYGLNQRKATSLLYAVAVLGVVVTLIPSLFDERAIGLTFAAFLVIILVGFRYLAPIEMRISGEVMNIMIKRPARQRISRAALTGYDFLVLILASLFAYFIETDGDLMRLRADIYLPTLVVTVAIGLLMLHAGKVYNRRWSRGTLRDFLAMTLWLMVGMMIAGTVNFILTGAPFETVRVQLTVLGVGALLVALPRLIFPMTRNMVVDSLHRHVGKSSGMRPRVVLYGAGDIGELFIQHLKITAGGHFDEYRILGFLDDHPELVGKHSDGFKILGDLSALPELIDEWNLSGVILTASNIPKKRMENISEACNRMQLKLFRWAPDLEVREIEKCENVNKSLTESEIISKP